MSYTIIYRRVPFRNGSIAAFNQINTIFYRHASDKVNSQTSTDYCLNLIKSNDYDNFMCTLLLPNDVRSCAIAVRAFNVEISKVCEQVTQKQIGLMRLKFWEDTVNGLYAKIEKPVPQHPVAIELRNVVKRFKLTKRHLNTLISCRADNIDKNSFANLEELEKYAEQSVSCVYYLLLEGCGVRNIQADHAASHLGKAQGISQQLRSIPHAKHLNFVPVPQSLLTKYRISHESVFRTSMTPAPPEDSHQFADCAYEVATRAHQHLQKARSLLPTVPAEGRCVLGLHATVVGDYLSRLEGVQYDVFSRRLQGRGQWVRVGWKVLWERYKLGRD